ncbi:MAG: OmpH family outer membrane protein [Acidobacteriota bacterium]|nr:OmpH family outer membrane protein [Acidobacteriota bacterium]
MLTIPAFAQQKRIALINSDAFLTPTSGIVRLVRAMEGVEREFAPHRRQLSEAYDELHRLKELPGYSGPIPTDPRPMTPERKKEIRDDIKAMTGAFEKSQRQVQTAYERRMKEALAPIQEDIRLELQRFAGERGIQLLIDSRSLACVTKCDPMIIESLDVTGEFIKEYNRRHP